MSVKGKIAHFYNDKPRAINSLWIMAQVVSVLFVICGLIALFVSPTGTAMGVVMKIYDVFVIALVCFMFIYKTMNKTNLESNELYVGYYIGLCMMTCMNLVVIAVLYGSQSNLIDIINGKAIAKTFYRLVASLAIFAIFFYILYVFFSIRFHSDIMTAHRSQQKAKGELPPKKETTPVETGMVLYNKPAESDKPTKPTKPVLPALQDKPAQAEPSKPTPLALPAPPQETNTSLVLAKPQVKKDTPALPNGMMAPPGMK